MYVVKIYREGQWWSWGSAASPKVINKYLSLLEIILPGTPVKVDNA